MSEELLVRLQAEHAFDAMPQRSDLADLHVPLSSGALVRESPA